MSEVFAIGPTQAIRTLREEHSIAVYFKRLQARHAHLRPDIDAEDEALKEINGALSQFAPIVKQRWQRAIPELT